MGATSKIILRKNHTNQAGEYGVVLRLTINRVYKFYSLGFSIQPGQWDDSAHQVKKHPDQAKLNYQISEIHSRINKFIFDQDQSAMPVTFIDFERIWYNKQYNGSSFYDFAKWEIENSMTGFSLGTIQGYRVQITKMAQLKKNLTFNDITLSFIRDYDNYIREFFLLFILFIFFSS